MTSRSTACPSWSTSFFSIVPIVSVNVIGVIGTPTAADTYAIGRDFPRIAEIQLQSSGDGRFTLATVALGDGGQFMHWLRGPGGEWSQLTRYEDAVTVVRFGLDGRLYLLSKKAASRGQLLRVSLAEPVLAKARVVSP